jgi:hypothetical protein
VGDADMKSVYYRILWLFEAAAVVVIALILILPIQDYARREHMEWYLHPSTQTLRVFQEKQHEEFRTRLSIAAPIAISALILAFPLFRLRSNLRKSA